MQSQILHSPKAKCDNFFCIYLATNILQNVAIFYLLLFSTNKENNSFLVYHHLLICLIKLSFNYFFSYLWKGHCVTSRNIYGWTLFSVFPLAS